MKKILIIIIFTFCFVIFGCTKKQEFSKTIRAFDADISVYLYEGDSSNLEDIINIYNDINKLTTAYQEYSGVLNICSINKQIKNGVLSFDISKELYEMLSMPGDDISSYICFSAGKLTNYWKDVISKKSEIDADKINQLKQEIADGKCLYTVTENPYKLTIQGSECQFDLGSIAKGYATKLVKEYLDANNISKYMIDCGTSCILLGKKYNGSSFNVGVMYIDDFVIKNVKNTSVATASILERKIEINDSIYHHIIDLTTGYPANTYDTICLVGGDPAILDMLSTYLMIVPNQANEVIEKYNINHCYMFKDGKLVNEVSGK